MTTESLSIWFQSLPVDEAETVKLEFAVAIDEVIKDGGLTRKAVADAMGTSPAWITKVLRGDVNLTIESMVKICNAIGHKLEIRVARNEFESDRRGISHREFLGACFAKAKTSTSYEFKLGPSPVMAICNDKEYSHAA